MGRFLQAFGAMALACAPAFAAPPPDWRALGTSEDLAIAWDAAGVERGATVVVPIRFTPLTRGGSGFAYAITRVEIDCRAAAAHAVATVNYRADGSAGQTDNVPEPFAPITPGTLFAELQRQVC